MTYAYVGCRTTRERNARGKGLKTYRIDDINGEWEEIQCLSEENPSYQCFDNNKEYLYTVHGDITKVSSYKILVDGTLEKINTIDIGGKNPVFITSDKSNKYLVVATLQGGAVQVIERKSDGSLGNIVEKVSYEGKTEGSISFVHQCIWDKNKEYIFAPAQGRIQGYGQIRVFRFNTENGTFKETCAIRAREYAEPRHIAIHPNNRFAYMINEKDNTMTYFSFNDKDGILKPLQIVPTLPEYYTGEGQASASVMDPTGKILVGSNRIHETLAVFRIDQNTGYMTLVNYVDVLGKTPRFITFNNDGSKFYVANEDSDTIVEMVLDIENSNFKPTVNVIHTESPVCIIFR